MSKYQFSKDILSLSAGNFKQFVKGRYPELSSGDLTGLVEEHYGKDEGVLKTERSGNSSKPKAELKSAKK